MSRFWWVIGAQFLPEATSLCVFLRQAYSHICDTCQAPVGILICGLAFLDPI